MKLHRNMALGILSALEETFTQQKSAAEIIQKTLKSNRGWGSRDRKMIAKAFYDILRNKRLYETLAEKQSSANPYWGLIAIWLLLNDHDLPRWPEFIIRDRDKVKTYAQVLIKQRTYKYSIPEWLDQKGVIAFGEKNWTQEIAALNRPAKLIIRCNTLRTSTTQIKQILEEKHQISTDFIPEYPDALILDKHRPLKDLEEYRKGLFEIQDANSQKIAPWLKPQPGKFYIDACAGAGGKSLHLASLTHDRAKILALDIFSSKLQELKKRCERNKILSIETLCIQDQNTLHQLAEGADGVLIDAPCSGLGVLKRNPDTKWSINPKRLLEITKTQAQILQTYASKVKKGGLLVYATCSILPEENSMQVSKFLNSKWGADFELEKEHTYFSHLTDFDGFYCARMIKKM